MYMSNMGVEHVYVEYACEARICRSRVWSMYISNIRVKHIYIEHACGEMYVSNMLVELVSSSAYKLCSCR